MKITKEAQDSQWKQCEDYDAKKKLEELLQRRNEEEQQKTKERAKVEDVKENEPHDVLRLCRFDLEGKEGQQWETLRTIKIHQYKVGKDKGGKNDGFEPLAVVWQKKFEDKEYYNTTLKDEEKKIGTGAGNLPVIDSNDIDKSIQSEKFKTLEKDFLDKQIISIIYKSENKSSTRPIGRHSIRQLGNIHLQLNPNSAKVILSKPYNLLKINKAHQALSTLEDMVAMNFHKKLDRSSSNKQDGQKVYKIWSITYNQEKQAVLKDLDYPTGLRQISKLSDLQVKKNAAYLYSALEDELKTNESSHYTFQQDHKKNKPYSFEMKQERI